jgi:hypothetical protein
LIFRISTWSIPSCLAALATTGSKSPFACMPPGARCDVRGGVFVSTVMPRHFIAIG